MTAQEVIEAAYRKRGTTATLTTAQKNAGLLDLQNLMASWSVEGLVVPYYVTENFTLTTGQAVYTIGVTGDSPDLVSATGRPLRIKNAFIRISNIDYSIDVGMTGTEYNNLTSKDLETRPWRLYYDPQYPTGKIKFNREADTTYDFHLVSEKALTELSALATTISLPREVNRALIYNLAIELATDKKIKLEAHVYVIAQESLDNLRIMNSREKLGGEVVLDTAIAGRGRSMNIDAGE